jgi:glycosyltransferase involved in cell wall biosynthesis
MLKLVSVIIPCYNQAKFLREAIESVLYQEHPRFELIVVDDGSIDETSDVAASYDRVRLIRQSNRGLAGARNRGLAASCGEYVTFLDSDDRLLPGALEVGSRQLDLNQEWAFVYGRYRYIDVNGAPLPQGQQGSVSVEDCGDSYEEMLVRNFIGMHGTVMYRREVLERLCGFDETFMICEDYELYLRICRQFPIGKHDNLVAEYRLHAESLSRDSSLMLKSAIRALHLQRQFIKGKERYQKAYKAGIRGWQELYGERVVEEIRCRFRDYGYLGLVQSLGRLFVLLRYYPQGIIDHGCRKIRCTFMEKLI